MLWSWWSVCGVCRLLCVVCSLLGVRCLPFVVSGCALVGVRCCVISAVVGWCVLCVACCGLFVV